MIFGSSRTEPHAELERARHVGVEQHERVLGRQREALGRRIVGHVAAGGLRRQPLAHVAFARAGARGELCRRQRARAGHRPVQAELVADHDESSVERGADVLNHLPEERLDLCPVEHCLSWCH